MAHKMRPWKAKIRPEVMDNVLKHANRSDLKLYNCVRNMVQKLLMTAVLHLMLFLLHHLPLLILTDN